MSTLPIYVWAMVLAGVIGTTATICVMLWRGATTAGVSRHSATRVAVIAGIVWGAWVLVSGLLANAEVFRFQPTKAAPWIAVAMIVPLVAVLLSTRVPLVSRILDQPDALWRLTLPQFFRPVGVTFLVAMALGYLPAVFAIPAGIGDIAIGVEAVFIARNLRRGIVHRSTVWFNVLGLLDLVVALAIGVMAAPGLARLLVVSPSTEAISLLPLVLIPTTIVPLAVALHVLSLRKLRVGAETATVVAPVGNTK
ncbi:hypothetical protein [Mycobacterium sp. AZCC_0083]|uniref:hypothetical protein n=1 Tax=Mycobacterium sp. AZCC_0083 TaxID=2735882 RepID=UPI00161C315E|nr:hypothetical protein [Mycobacterium sp. AZCC_0083]MBB5168450.1 hypothetical protein [Mycobacterium sp. AZCC_0083]